LISTSISNIPVSIKQKAGVKAGFFVCFKPTPCHIAVNLTIILFLICSFFVGFLGRFLCFFDFVELANGITSTLKKLVIICSVLLRPKERKRRKNCLYNSLRLTPMPLAPPGRGSEEMISSVFSVKSLRTLWLKDFKLKPET
jgi:hypothetical protein